MAKSTEKRQKVGLFQRFFHPSMSIFPRFPTFPALSNFYSRKAFRVKDESVTRRLGFNRPDVGWVEEARTERDGEGTAGCARFRLASLPHAARPHALPVGRARVE